MKARSERSLLESDSNLHGTVSECMSGAKMTIRMKLSYKKLTLSKHFSNRGYCEENSLQENK